MVSYNLNYLSKRNIKLYEQETPIDLFSTKKLNVEIVKSAMVYPCSHDGKREGVFDSNGNFIARTNLHEVLGDKPLYPKNEVPHKHKVAIYIGDLYSCFGHSLTDNLKKLWFLKTEAGKDLLAKGAEIVYVTFNGEKLGSHVFRIFELAGFDLHRAIEVTEPLTFDFVYIPEDSIFIEEERRYYTKEFKSAVDSIIQEAHLRVSVPSYQKIYLSRTLLKDKEDFGELKIEKAFANKGYKVIHPEKYSVEEQVCYLNQTTEVAATLGSISHLSLFALPETKVVILLKNDYLNTYQTVIDAIAGNNVIYINSHHTFKQKKFWDGPFYLSITKHLSLFLCVNSFLNFRVLDIEWYRYMYRFLQLKKQAIKRKLVLLLKQ